MNVIMEKLKTYILKATKESSKEFIDVCESSPDLNLNQLDREGNSLFSYIVTFYFFENEQSHEYNLLNYILTKDIEKNIPNNNGFPPIFLAASSYSSIVFAKLLSLPDIDILYKNEKQNLLHFACTNGNIENVERLIEKNVFSLKEKDNNGNTPFMLACSFFRLAQYFLIDLNYEINDEEIEFLNQQKNKLNSRADDILDMYNKRKLNDSLNISLKENNFQKVKHKV